MTEWTPEEDDAFNEVEKHSNLGKQILQDIEGLAFVHLDTRDVVRHRIVADIVAAYERKLGTMASNRV